MHMDTYSCILCRVGFQDLANGSTTKMAKTLSRGSAGCIAALDEMNPRKTISGEEPWLGVGLKVNWGRIIGMETYLSMIIYHPSNGR